MVNVLDQTSSSANRFLAELRDVSLQTDRARFRHNLERLGELMAYEISQTFPFAVQPVRTPLGTKNISLPEVPVLVTVMRAGLPFWSGFQRCFDQADSGFIGAWREETGRAPDVKLSYQALPDVNNRIVILIDPMLATGKSMARAIAAIRQRGQPKHIHLAALVGAPEGVDFLQQSMTGDVTLWLWSLDEKLDHRYYIVPGLGDAGDLSFGEK